MTGFCQKNQKMITIYFKQYNIFEYISFHLIIFPGGLFLEINETKDSHFLLS